MAEVLSLDPRVVAVILAMAVVTFLTKVGGLWLLSRFEVSDRLEAGISVLPGAIVIAILGPEFASGGPAEWAAGGLTLLVMWRTGNILLALVAGVVGVVAFRAVG
ncbi:branched-chain amino acid transport protein AzlD [Halalkalicoccus paucihalophilus]|uniref:Branched-chain amino acid transport protein AzlD n=1 Tax=Halalkalicoccus paucihalophilus TaxID=1008153 RepID=A0A151AEF0_9EURY|nr:AzlD domain-containing protein [Halalkalicoccus paucihalophilus]KYH26046.1 branched-chain amino acid transport protein AzlD [Halalkalicoccus paucihalophilus]